MIFSFIRFTPIPAEEKRRRALGFPLTGNIFFMRKVLYNTEKRVRQPDSYVYNSGKGPSLQEDAVII